MDFGQILRFVVSGQEEHHAGCYSASDFEVRADGAGSNPLDYQRMRGCIGRPTELETIDTLPFSRENSFLGEEGQGMPSRRGMAQSCLGGSARPDGVIPVPAHCIETLVR